MRSLLSQLSGIIFLLGFIPYVLAIFGRKLVHDYPFKIDVQPGEGIVLWLVYWKLEKVEPTKPMKASWLIWFCLDALTLSGMWAKHAVNGQIVGAAATAFLVFVLSLKYGKTGWTRVDQWSLAGAVAGVGLWLAFDSPVLGILIAQLTGIIGAIPTFMNIWYRPQDEPRFGWLFFWASCLPALLAIPILNWEHIM